MLKNKSIAIISANTLLAIGLRELLNTYFVPRNVEIFSNPEDFFEFEPTTAFDLIFSLPEEYIAQMDSFQAFKSNLVILSQLTAVNSMIPVLNYNLREDEIVAELEKLFNTTVKNNAENAEELSNREIDVLKLVSLGRMNKQIADQLNISMHTVISHRKNITRKLGIKTVSGLTVYALMNGIIGSGEVD